MSRRTIWKFIMFAGACGASLAAGSIRGAYPELAAFQPTLAYIAGFMMAVALFVDPPRFSALSNHHPETKEAAPPTQEKRG